MAGKNNKKKYVTTTSNGHQQHRNKHHNNEPAGSDSADSLLHTSRGRWTLHWSVDTCCRFPLSYIFNTGTIHVYKGSSGKIFMMRPLPLEWGRGGLLCLCVLLSQISPSAFPLCFPSSSLVSLHMAPLHLHAIPPSLPVDGFKFRPIRSTYFSRA